MNVKLLKILSQNIYYDSVKVQEKYVIYASNRFDWNQRINKKEMPLSSLDLFVYYSTNNNIFLHEYKQVCNKLQLKCWLQLQLKMTP